MEGALKREEDVILDVTGNIADACVLHAPLLAISRSSHSRLNSLISFDLQHAGLSSKFNFPRVKKLLVFVLIAIPSGTADCPLRWEQEESAALLLI
jgi:hypothetical protein